MELTSPAAKAKVIGAQPIAVAAGALVIVVGIASVILWGAHTRSSSDQERTVSAHLMQTRAAQVSDQLVEKTNGLELSQQESVDQLQVVQGQLLVVKRLLNAQQTETKRLSEQVGSLTDAIETLRQSFASTSEASSLPPTRKKSIRSRSRETGRMAAGHRKRAKSRS